MREQASQEQLLDYFASYVSPQKVKMYAMWGVDFIPGRREGVRVWDHDGKRSWIDCRSAGGVFNLGHRPPRSGPSSRRGPGRSGAWAACSGGRRRRCTR